MTITTMTPEQLATAPWLTKFDYAVDLLGMSLPSYQGQLVTFIARRTLRWGKDREIIPLDHFEDGITNSKTDEWVIHGLNMTRKTIIKMLKALVDAGWVLRTEIKTDHGNVAHAYEFNWEKIAMAFLPISKKEKKKAQTGQDQDDSSVRGTPLSSGHGTPLTSVPGTPKDTNKTHKQRHQTARKRAPISDGSNLEKDTSEGMGLSDVIEQGRRVTKTNRTRKARSEKLTSIVVETIWEDALIEAWPGIRHMGWTGKTKGHANHLVKYIGEAVREFLPWAIHNWPMVRLAKFPAKREVQCPKMPDFVFLFNFRRDFMDVWNDREFYASLAGNPKAGLIVWLRNQGYSIEDAIEEAGQRDLHKQRMDELDGREEEIRALHRQVGLVYNPSHGIKHAAKEAEARIAASTRAVNRGASTNDADLGDRARQIKGWDDE